jgi:glycosyltransferase involved in cell wall biosynthesis
LVKPAYLYSEGVYANGTALQALAQKFTPKKPIHNIPNGVDTETFYPTNTNETDTLKLLYVGQLISRKRIEEILQTLHHFGNKHSIKLHISIVGDGPLMPSIKLLCQSLPNSISYTLHGQLDRAALPEIYRNHHILLQLSKAEGVSNTVLEGIASGLHLIASDSAAGELDIEGKAFCRFIDCNDKDELTRNLGDTLVEINKRKKTIIKKSQKEAVTFIKKYSWDERAKELEKYLKKVAK